MDITTQLITDEEQICSRTGETIPVGTLVDQVSTFEIDEENPDSPPVLISSTYATIPEPEPEPVEEDEPADAEDDLVEF